MRKFKFRLDLHVHTRRFSPCAETLDPELLPLAMVRRKLDGIVITEHDQLWPLEETAALNRRLPRGRIYRGIEVSSRNGHFVVIGLTELDGVCAGMSVDALIRAADAQAAAVIWAHPGLRYGNTPEPLLPESMPAGIHAVETASGVTRGEDADRALAYARSRRLPAVGGSDAHVLSQVGCAVTLFTHLPANEKVLAADIRAGRCAVPVAGADRCGGVTCY